MNDPKPRLEIPDDDGQDPGEEPVPDEHFMHPHKAAGDDTIDDGENDDRPAPVTGPRRGSGDRNSRAGTDVVPRKMLELCKNTLRRSLVRNIQLQDRVAQLEHEVQRLQKLLRR